MNTQFANGPDFPEMNKCDRALLISVICLLLFGLLMVYSSTSVVAPDSKGMLKAANGVSQFSYLKRHLFSMTIGVVLMMIAFRIDLGKLSASWLILLVTAAVLTTLIFVPGAGLNINGARRWIRLWHMTFQPSEFTKFAMVVFMAKYISSPKFDPNRYSDFLKPLGVMVCFQGLLLLQPDFGAAVTLALITFTMLFLAGVRKRFLASTLVLLVPVAIKLVMVPYRLKRVLAFMDPWSNQRGSGYQLVQSLIALGSGGMTGVGLGQSRQKLAFLPYINTDFIFSLMGEELGFIGVAFIIGVFGLIFLRGMKIAARSRDPFEHYLGQGLTYFIIYQMMINISVVTGLAPTKGLPLPFISYGGSSLMINMICAGLLLNISCGRRKSYDTDQNRDLIRRKKARISVYGRDTKTGVYS